MRKILLVSDSPGLHTGFGLVTRKLADYIYDNAKDKYIVSVLGWYHNPKAPEKRPYRIHTTQIGPGGRPDQGDKWGQVTLPRVIEMEKPDIVWGLGDMWMLAHLPKIPGRNTFKYVSYHPIDGEPMPKKMMVEQEQYIDWVDIIKGADYPIAFCDWGMRTINDTANCKICKQWIPHGVDTKIYRPRSDDERKALKQKHFPGLHENAIVVGCFARNQPRKSFDKLIHAISIYVSKYEKDNTPVYLYLHCALEDKTGWNIEALIRRYGLDATRLITDKTLDVGIGLPEEVLAERYVACDMMALPTRGEGWGLPILEAMSCGIPVITTKYSAHADYCEPGSVFINIVTREAEPITNIERVIPSVEDFAKKIMYLADSPDVRKDLGAAGRARAITLDWEQVVLPQWVELFDSIDTGSNISRPEIVEIPEFGEITV